MTDKPVFSCSNDELLNPQSYESVLAQISKALWEDREAKAKRALLELGWLPPKVTTALITHFIEHEGTDYLGDKDEPTGVDGLSEREEDCLRRQRDLARKLVGWEGY